MENTGHLFRDCEFTKRIWMCSSLGIQPQAATNIPIVDWIRNLLNLFWKEDGIKSERVQEFVLTLWFIWIFRNNIVFQNQYDNPITIYKRKETLLSEYAESKKLKVANPRSTQSRTTEQPEEIRQTSNLQYDTSCIILVDGAWKRYKKFHPRAGIGWVARENEAILFEGNANVMASTPTQAEAYALFHAMRTTYNRGIRQATFISDCAELVRAIDSQHHPFEITTIIHDINSLRAKFDKCEIKKVNRIDVKPAHVLAQAARQGDERYRSRNEQRQHRREKWR
ncbi:uncharacterized protein LOC125496252 [Beta vulgaris subsp. vulgaris]|uniref:uncharacterized protein LOC125496252 n=1 Tax=Beta vulgaris subsp. vulgaris TaxID=3555 RepID=UPI00203698F0|nr:uncharacterized protein LOC125496252 [Beta vulgaris subsp. vulgaris]